MTKPWRVVITRPTAQAAPWAAQLAREGIASEQLPLIELLPVSDPAAARAIQNQVMDFDLYHKAIFVSRNAVRYAMEWLERYWPQLPVGVSYFAVGATTAAELAHYGLAVRDLACAESGSMTSETLLEAEGLQQVAGEKIIIFRGQGGRGHMADVLRERGALVDYCELYQRQLPAGAGQALQQLLASPGWGAAQQIIALHSGESLQQLAQLLAQPAFATQHAVLKQAWLLLPSERLLNEAERLGFKRCLAAQNATDNAMSQAITRLMQTHCDG